MICENKEKLYLIKSLLLLLDEKVYVGKRYCENKKIYADWSDLKEKELFCEVHKHIKKKQTYQLTLPEDEYIVDMIVESNFRYFSYISLYLPKSNVIIQPTCHTEIIIYAFDIEKIEENLKEIVKKYSDIKITNPILSNSN